MYANPERIDQAARAMGMVSPARDQIVTVNTGIVPATAPAAAEETPTQLAQRTDN
jgi:hypothetical protein